MCHTTLCHELCKNGYADRVTIWTEGSTVWGGANVPFHEGTLSPPDKYDWTFHLLRRCGLMSNQFDHSLSSVQYFCRLFISSTTFWWNKDYGIGKPPLTTLKCCEAMLCVNISWAAFSRWEILEYRLSYIFTASCTCKQRLHLWTYQCKSLMNINSSIGSRPSDHYFRSVCLSVCLFVCLFVCLCRVFLSRLWSDFDETRTYVICLGLVVSPRI